MPHCLGQLVRKKTIYYAKENKHEKLSNMIRGKYKLLVYTEIGVISEDERCRFMKAGVHGLCWRWDFFTSRTHKKWVFYAYYTWYISMNRYGSGWFGLSTASMSENLN